MRDEGWGLRVLEAILGGSADDWELRALVDCGFGFMI